MTEEVKPQQVRAQLARLRAAEPFASSPQLVSFLDYVVEQALAGRGRELKGYTIAVEALGRPAEFDPQTDPIVRVEARRLRQALRTYYSAAGKNDPIRISIPTGGYVPVFMPSHATGEPDADAMAPADATEETDEESPELAADSDGDERADDAADAPPAAMPDVRRAPTRRWLFALAGLGIAAALGTGVVLRGAWDRAALSSRIAAGHGGDQKAARLPTIRVLTFEAVGGDSPPVDIARRVAERLATSLARYDEVRVIGPAGPSSPQEFGDYLLRGRLSQRQDGGFSLGVALLAPVTREVLLPRDFPLFRPDELAAAPAGAISEAQAVRALTIEIAQPGGFISADQITRLAGEASDEGRCLYAAQAYWRAPSRDLHARVRECLKGASISNLLPQALAQAHLCMLALDEYRNDYTPEPGPPALDRALAHAQAAIAAAPSSPRAQQALMDALFVRGQAEQAIEAGQRAIQLNPFDIDILADYGARLVQTERVREGREKLLEAAAYLSIRPPWHDFYLVLSAVLVEDHAAAQTHADAIVSEADPLSLIARILAAKDRGAIDQAEAMGRKLVALDSRYRTDPRAMLARRAMSPPVLDLLATTIEGVTRNGRS